MAERLCIGLQNRINVGSNPSRASNFIMNVDIIKKQPAETFIKRYHYSQILPRLTKYYLGLYEDEKLVGVVTLGWGTQPKQTIKKLFPDYDTEDYLEIGKMCFLPEKNGNKNFGSQAMAAIIKWMKQNLEVSFLYTLADGIMGKCGYVYQASNFQYIGSFKTPVYMDRNTKEKIHPRSARKLCEENARFSGREKIFWLTRDFCEYKGIDKIEGLMFRYIYPLNKKARKAMKVYPALANPKEEDLLFWRRTETGKELIEKPDFNMKVFQHNFQKPESSNTLF